MRSKRMLTLPLTLLALCVVVCDLQAEEDPAVLDQQARSGKGAFMDREEAVRKLGKLASDGDGTALGLLLKLAYDKALAPGLHEVSYSELVKLESSQRLDAKQMAEILKAALEDDYYTSVSIGCRAVVNSNTLDMATKVELLASLLRRECAKPEDKRGAYGARSYFTLGPDIHIRRCVEGLVALGPKAAEPLAAFLAKDPPQVEVPDEVLSVCLVFHRLKAKEASSDDLLKLASKARSPYLVAETLKELQVMGAKDAIPYIKTQLENGFALELKYTLYYPVRDAAMTALKELDPGGAYDNTVVRVDEPGKVEEYKRLHALNKNSNRSRV